MASGPGREDFVLSAAPAGLPPYDALKDVHLADFQERRLQRQLRPCPCINGSDGTLCVAIRSLAIPENLQSPVRSALRQGESFNAAIRIGPPQHHLPSEASWALPGVCASLTTTAQLGRRWRLKGTGHLNLHTGEVSGWTVYHTPHPPQIQTAVRTSQSFSPVQPVGTVVQPPMHSPHSAHCTMELYEEPRTMPPPDPSSQGPSEHERAALPARKVPSCPVLCPKPPALVPSAHSGTHQTPCRSYPETRGPGSPSQGPTLTDRGMDPFTAGLMAAQMVNDPILARELLSGDIDVATWGVQLDFLDKLQRTLRLAKHNVEGKPDARPALSHKSKHRPVSFCHPPSRFQERIGKSPSRVPKPPARITSSPAPSAPRPPTKRDCGRPKPLANPHAPASVVSAQSSGNRGMVARMQSTISETRKIHVFLENLEVAPSGEAETPPDQRPISTTSSAICVDSLLDMDPFNGVEASPTFSVSSEAPSVRRRCVVQGTCTSGPSDEQPPISATVAVPSEKSYAPFDTPWIQDDGGTPWDAELELPGHTSSVSENLTHTGSQGGMQINDWCLNEAAFSAGVPIQLESMRLAHNLQTIGSAGSEATLDSVRRSCSLVSWSSTASMASTDTLLMSSSLEDSLRFRQRPAAAHDETATGRGKGSRYTPSAAVPPPGCSTTPQPNLGTNERTGNPADPEAGGHSGHPQVEHRRASKRLSIIKPSDDLDTGTSSASVRRSTSTESNCVSPRQQRVSFGNTIDLQEGTEVPSVDSPRRRSPLRHVPPSRVPCREPSSPIHHGPQNRNRRSPTTASVQMRPAELLFVDALGPLAEISSPILKAALHRGILIRIAGLRLRNQASASNALCMRVAFGDKSCLSASADPYVQCPMWKEEFRLLAQGYPVPELVRFELYDQGSFLGHAEVPLDTLVLGAALYVERPLLCCAKGQIPITVACIVACTIVGDATPVQFLSKEALPSDMQAAPKVNNEASPSDAPHISVQSNLKPQPDAVPNIPPSPSTQVPESLLEPPVPKNAEGAPDFISPRMSTYTRDTTLWSLNSFSSLKIGSTATSKASTMP